MDGLCDQRHQWFFCLYLTLISVSTPFSPALIATGEYLSAHNWQASLRVLLKWCYTGPSTCNCVAAAQSWPLKGRAVIYLKWQQPHFLSAGGTTTKNPPSTALYLFWQWRWAGPFPCICMPCCETAETASCVVHSRSGTSWPLSASCHHDTKLQRNGLCSQGPFTNPVKCSTAIDMAYLNKQGLYRLCSVQPFLRAFLSPCLSTATLH